MSEKDDSNNFFGRNLLCCSMLLNWEEVVEIYGEDEAEEMAEEMAEEYREAK